ncbi:MAG: hypothetical protein ABJ327_25675 [Litoreibacter sp.]
MKHFIVSLAVVASLSTGAAVAAGSGGGATLELSSLSAEQLDALTGVLTGLPRQ